MAFTGRVSSSSNSLYNEDRNLLRIREKERRNQEAHQEKEAFSEKIPLFGEPYKTEKGDELSSRIQNMLGNYEEVKELLSTKSLTHHLDASENRPGKQRSPLLPEKGSGVPAHSFHNRVHHQPGSAPAPGPLPVGNMSHHQKVTQPRMEPIPSLHVKSYGAPDSQHLAPDRLGQEGYGSSHRRNGDRRAEGDHCASTADPAPQRELSPLLSSLPSPLPPLSPPHSNQQALPRTQGSSKVHSGNNNNSKGCCHAKSPKDLALKIRDKETPKDSLMAVSSLGVAPPQPPSQSFPPPPLPSKSVAMQQKPTAYVRPMDGQDQAPSESPELKPLPEDYRQQTFEKTDLKVPAKAKLTKLKMPSQSVETYSNEAHCVEEILKEMTHSWPPPLTAIHTPSTAEPSKFPFPTKDSQHIISATQNQKQYDTSSKTRPHSQQGTSMLEDDLQLSDSEDSESEQTPEKPPSTSAPPSAPQSLPEAAAAASAHSSGAESESTSDSDSSSDSESESSSSDSEENEPQDTPAPEPEPPTTNKWQLDNWLTKVNQPAAPPEALGGAAPPLRHPDGKGKGGDGGTTGHEHSEPKGPPPKSSSRAPRAPPEGSHTGKRSCQKSPAQQEPPQRQTVGTKQPKKPVKASAPADSRASVQVESEPGLPHSAKDQPSKDKPKVKTKGRPRAGDREPKPAAPAPTPGEKRRHRGGPPAPAKALSGPEPAKDNVEDRSPEHLALVPLTHSQGPKHDSSSGGRTSGCRRAVVVQEDPGKDKLQVPLRDTKLLSPLRDAPALQSLVVKITLDLLSWVPQPPGKGSRQKKPEDKQPPAGKKLDSEKRSSDNSSKLAKKRRGEAERDHDSKKVRLEKEVKSQSSSSSHKEASKTKTPKPSEPSKKEMLPPTPVSSSSSSSQKPAKPAQKRPRREAHACSQDSPQSASGTKGSHKDSPAPKRRKAEGKGSGSSTEHKGSSGDTTNPFPVPSLPNGNSKPGKPPGKLDKQADLHMKEAKKLKQKAELMTDKVGKAFKYLEAVLSFIECGIAMESESPVSKSTSKSAFSVYSETEDLIKSIMSLKSFSDPTAPTQEKIFAVLCMRCQSILNMAMFRCKKERAIKYSRALNDHFQSSPKVTQAPSPCIARSTGAPSPRSPMPSVGSVGSQAGAGSVGGGGIPASIQNMTSSYITITSHIFAAVDLWEQAEVLTRKNKEFFAQLSTSVCTLALNSSLADLVHYTRQGFQWLKQGNRAP
ncbi:AF4/FMR2 family member 1 isoform X2 [Pipistrellus kuhlii]|uniref:AF4/FMR2 family member 1 isoform X2 n=1 Tax=Pipistrellus kuhlii TaxID=59472 RepID=UPI00174F2C3D|nr:AF4/FMR2 family member 1 isoform X2 [Pipistrellus kuhlii]